VKCQDIGFQFNPKTIITDFEQAAVNAVTVVFPQVVLCGCRFHIGQCWWRRMQSLGLADDYQEKSTPEAHWLVKSNQIKYGFNDG